jgi:cellulose synthase/poly-beta-1,6-N-acetylglucosamine synthase-like glycosyltransferase
MTILHFLFYASIGVLFYSYLGYGGLLWLFTRAPGKKKDLVINMDLPAVTIIIAAYNEASVLEQKIANTRAISYPWVHGSVSCYPQQLSGNSSPASAGTEWEVCCY